MFKKLFGKKDTYDSLEIHTYKQEKKYMTEKTKLEKDKLLQITDNIFCQKHNVETSMLHYIGITYIVHISKNPTKFYTNNKFKYIHIPLTKLELNTKNDTLSLKSNHLDTHTTNDDTILIVGENTADSLIFAAIYMMFTTRTRLKTFFNNFNLHSYVEFDIYILNYLLEVERNIYNSNSITLEYMLAKHVKYVVPHKDFELIKKTIKKNKFDVHKTFNDLL